MTRHPRTILGLLALIVVLAIGTARMVQAGEVHNVETTYTRFGKLTFEPGG